MNENFTNTDTLVQFLDGELQGETLAGVQRQIATNHQLAGELDSLRMAKAAVQTYGLQKNISAIHAEMMQELNTKEAAPPRIGMRRMMQYSLRIAAMVIVLLGAGFLYQYFSATTEKLFKDGYTGFDLHETRGSANSSALEDAYKKHDNAAVITIFSTLTAPSAEDYFLHSVAALSSKDAPAAIQSLMALQEKNKKDNTHFFEDDAAYYLGLAYLQNNEPAKAYPLFEAIQADAAHPYHNRVSSWWLRKLKHLASR